MLRVAAAAGIAAILFGQPLVAHAAACKFSVVTSANAVTNGNDLFAVSATAASDAWAVGYFTTAAGYPQTLAEHWNGTAWSIVASPNKNTSSNNINGMAAISSTKVYGTGDYYTGTVFDTLAETWNGSTRTIQSSPNHGTNTTVLFGMAGSAMTGVLSVGEYIPGTYTKTFAVKLTPTGWKIVPSANVGAFDSFLNGAGAIPGTDDAWGVGGSTNSDHSYHKTLIELFSC